MPLVTASRVTMPHLSMPPAALPLFEAASNEAQGEIAPVRERSSITTTAAAAAEDTAVTAAESPAAAPRVAAEMAGAAEIGGLHPLPNEFPPFPVPKILPQSRSFCFYRISL
ncbi:hypothetical protein CLOP_g10685 [Closterium sp. NIES-67]|nr:hypothetical protein CLOP_g10685 [Closterium sp. NIES-67]